MMVTEQVLDRSKAPDGTRAQWAAAKETEVSAQRLKTDKQGRKA